MSQCLVHHERDTLPETQDSHCHLTQEQRDRGDGASEEEDDSRDGGCAGGGSAPHHLQQGRDGWEAGSHAGKKQDRLN